VYLEEDEQYRLPDSMLTENTRTYLIPHFFGNEKAGGGDRGIQQIHNSMLKNAPK